MKSLLKIFFRLLGIEVKRYHPDRNEWLTHLNIDTIIDIGANEGQFALSINKLLPQAKIHSFEPVSKCFSNLEKNTKHLPISIHPYALGDREGTTQINVSSHSPSSSILTMGALHKNLYSHSAQHVTEDIKIKCLDAFHDTFGLPGSRCFVKIDVQGFEDRVIAGGARVLQQAVAIQIEMTYYELYENQKLFDEIYAQLRSLGFRFKGNLNQMKDPNNGRITYSDSIFVNERFLAGNK